MTKKTMEDSLSQDSKTLTKLTDLYSSVDTMLSKTGDTVVLDTRFLSLTTLPGPEFDWEGKIKLVGKEVLYAFLSKIYFLRESGNITLTIDNYGSGTWWPLKYVRISLQPGGYLIYDRYHEPIDFEGLITS